MLNWSPVNHPQNFIGKIWLITSGCLDTYEQQPLCLQWMMASFLTIPTIAIEIVSLRLTILFRVLYSYNNCYCMISTAISTHHTWSPWLNVCLIALGHVMCCLIALGHVMCCLIAVIKNTIWHQWNDIPHSNLIFHLLWTMSTYSEG